MSNKLITFEDLKLSLTPAQRRAAELIVNNDFAPKGERKTLGEVADELSISRKALYNWRQRNDFVRYMAAISDNRLDQYRSQADAQLMKLVMGTSNNGLPSVRGLELFYEMIGRTKQAPLIQLNDIKKATMTREEASEELDKFIN